MPPDAPRTLADRLRLIEFLLLDVDGVLTDGGIIYSDRGAELKRFHVRDGSGLKIWHFAGKRSGIITGRTSEVVRRRATELGISPIIQGAEFKLPAMKRLLETTGMRTEHVCTIADDVPDLGLVANSGLGVAVADAAAEVRAAAHYVTQTEGGHGAVREVIELILRTQGRWRAVVDRFQTEQL